MLNGQFVPLSQSKTEVLFTVTASSTGGVTSFPTTLVESYYFVTLKLLLTAYCNVNLAGEMMNHEH